MTTPCAVQGGEPWLMQVEMQSLYPLPGQEIECTSQPAKHTTTTQAGKKAASSPSLNFRI